MWQMAGTTFSSRLLLGSGKFRSATELAAVIAASQCAMVTLAMRRVDPCQLTGDEQVAPVMASGVPLLPNTAGARSAAEAVQAARLARAALDTPWIKLEIHPDPRHLMPDPIETLAAARQLVAEGFIVLPDVHADPVLCKRLEEEGCAAVMPLAAPIGSNRGLCARHFLELIIAQAQVPVIVDAGLGAPSHAAAALEMGAAAVLVNTAIATAADPVAMALAFRHAVEAGGLASQAGLGPVLHGSQWAAPSSPLTAFLQEGA